MTAVSTPTDTRTDGSTLERGALSTRDLVVAGMSFMAPGFSLFFTTAVIAGVAGVYVPLIYVLTGAGVLCTAVALAEFSRLAPSAGSLQVFIGRAFGRRSGVAGGAVLLVGYLFLGAAVVVLFGGWSQSLLKEYLSIDIPWQVLSVIGVILITAGMVRGVHLSLRATGIFFAIEFLIVLALGLAVILSGGAHGLSAKPFDPSFSGIKLEGVALGMVFATFSLIGFEGSITFAEETPNPKRAVPIAVIGGLLGILALYVLMMYAAVVGFGVHSIDKLSGDSEPLATLAKMFASPLEPLLKIAVWTSIVACLLSAGNSQARVLFNMGREGGVSRAFARIHPRFHTPHVALIAWEALLLIPGLIASIWWDYVTSFANLAGFASLVCILVYMAATGGLVFYVRREQHTLRPIAHVLVPAIGVAIWLIPLWGSVKPGQVFPYNYYPWLALATIAGGGIYAWLRTRSVAGGGVVDAPPLQP